MRFHMHDRGFGPNPGRWGGQRGGGGSRGGFDFGGFSMEFGERGGGREGGRARRMFDGGELRLVLLKLIADEPRHGYDLIREIETLTGGAYAPSPGVVYPTLTLLDEMGMIGEQQSEGAKKRFAVSDEGRRHLEQNADVVAALMERLAHLGGKREEWTGSPVWRAVRNLGLAIRQRVSRGDMTPDTLHDVAAMIDELAQKIERLR
ncbi:PadR family transcriptional regulator [Sphingomonas bacterium]|uniref:PadR family transcriptional regulator n=1 Tax=Sphingomonas bacterium TaxID=1895847 RepID=UPI0015757589|nr:PadR family transcriptional regulator [Sphingomonas bacterium]